MGNSKLCGIYKITNIKNGYSYIGQSKDIVQRFRDHFGRNVISLNSSKIDRAILSEGKENFTFQILELCNSNDLDWKEDYYIKYFQSIEFGYNIVYGGQNNVGESNSNSKLTAHDIINIREAYKNHKDPQTIYDTGYKDKISIYHFFCIWEGTSWTNIHMDVYTDENRAYYKSLLNHQDKERTNFSDDDILRFRQRYVNERAIDIYRSEGISCNFNTFRSILTGSVYKHLPFYNKRMKVWVQL